jgi:hypothetical protein
MNIRRVLGFLILIGGVGLIVFSNYIKGRVEEGEAEISSAQKKVEQGNSLFSLNPYSKLVGQQVSGSAQKKINEGKQQVSYYNQLSGQLQIGGIIVIILGIVIILIPRRSKR